MGHLTTQLIYLYVCWVDVFPYTPGQAAEKNGAPIGGPVMAPISAMDAMGRPSHFDVKDEIPAGMKPVRNEKEQNDDEIPPVVVG